MQDRLAAFLANAKRENEKLSNGGCDDNNSAAASATASSDYSTSTFARNLLISGPRGTRSVEAADNLIPRGTPTTTRGHNRDLLYKSGNSSSTGTRSTTGVTTAGGDHQQLQNRSSRKRAASTNDGKEDGQPPIKGMATARRVNRTKIKLRAGSKSVPPKSSPKGNEEDPHAAVDDIHAQLRAMLAEEAEADTHTGDDPHAAMRARLAAMHKQEEGIEKVVEEDLKGVWHFLIGNWEILRKCRGVRVLSHPSIAAVDRLCFRTLGS